MPVCLLPPPAPCPALLADSASHSALSPVSQIRDLPELISSLLITANETRGALALALLHYTHANGSACPQGTIVSVFCISQHISLAPCDLNCSYTSERRSLYGQSTRMNEGTPFALLMCSVCLKMLPEPASEGTVEGRHSV